MSVRASCKIIAGWLKSDCDYDFYDQLQAAGIDYDPFDPMMGSKTVVVGEVIAEFDEYSHSVLVPVPDLHNKTAPVPPAIGDNWVWGIWFIGDYR